MLKTHDYLLTKLADAEIRHEPFPHLYVEDFLGDTDFHELVTSPEIGVPPATTNREMFAYLDEAGYQAIEFPGCTKSRSEYIAWLEESVRPRATHAACEGQGMALRCAKPTSPGVKALDAFFRSDDFRATVLAKFGIAAPVTLDCGLQKYLNGYEISPHPDIRQKALTWMFNANPGQDSEHSDYHTHYMTFTKDWDFVRRFWRDHREAETCWVPWDWCHTEKRQTANNSLVVFAPRFDTLHAVRARYDHLGAQRTQFYGNLWYAPAVQRIKPTFHDFANGSAPDVEALPSPSRGEVLSTAVTRAVTRFVKWSRGADPPPPDLAKPAAAYPLLAVLCLR